MFDATFWVAVSFVIFFVGLIYLKVPQNVNGLLTKMIVDRKNVIDESEKLRSESKKLLDDAQSTLNSAEQEKKKIINQANIEAEKLTKDMSEKFSKSAEIKKNLANIKISQMKDAAIKDVKDTSIKIAIESVKKTISISVDKSKLDTLFEKNLEETKIELKKVNS